MNIKNFSYMVEIAKCGAINKAAKNLYMSQPTLSAVVKSMEGQLGFPIFKRYNKGVVLTPEGEVFMLSANNIISELQNIEKIPMQFSGDSGLSISCTYSSTFMESFMEFKSNQTGNDFGDAFKETGLIQTIQDVIEKRYKLSLIYCFDSRTAVHRQTIEKYNLDMTHIASGICPRALVSSKGKYRNQSAISFDELKDERFATYENFAYEDWLEVLGRGRQQKTLFIFDRGGLVDSVIKGGYVSVVMGEISAEQERQGCKTLTIEGFEDKLSVFLIKHKQYELSPRDKRFLAILKKNLQMI